MEKKENCNKVCWYTRIGDILDCCIPLTPKNKKD